MLAVSTTPKSKVFCFFFSKKKTFPYAVFVAS
jgi:hypothetical protein